MYLEVISLQNDKRYTLLHLCYVTVEYILVKIQFLF